MIGIPEQKKLCEIWKLPINHVSAYIFEAEHTLPEDETAQLYLKTVETLEQNGFSQYEISNFAKQGSEPCRHNLKYWLCEDYIGIGPTAHSCYGGKRYALPTSGDSAMRLTTEENACNFEERLMLGLRLTRGIQADDETLARAEKLPAEYVRIKGRNLSLTAKGFLVSNMIIAELLL
jgi:oxygen-independent coproporphyrinogen-3 oxidase